MSSPDPNESLAKPSAVSDAATASESPTEKKRARWPLFLAVSIAVFAAVICSFDELPPDVSDLEIAPLNLADEHNFIVLIDRAAAAANLAVPNFNDDEGRDALPSYAGGQPWNDALVNKWMVAMEPVWPLYEAASLATEAQLPAPDKFDGDREARRLRRKITLLAGIKAENEWRHQRPAEATRFALLILRNATLVQRSRSNTLSYITTSGDKSFAFGIMEDIARQPNVSIESLREMIAAIEASRDSGEGLRNAYKTDFQEFRAYQKKLETDGLDLVRMRSSPLAKIPAKWTPGLYKHNKTLRICASITRRLLEEIGSDIATIRALHISIARQFPEEGSIAALNPDNYTGRKLLLAGLSGPIGLRANSRDQSHGSVLQAFIALKLYQREHGELPATLDALVPTYLPAVPKDYAAGAPVSYSAQLGVVWSSGDNRLAITSADQDTEYEIVIWLVPRKPPAQGPFGSAETTTEDPQPSTTTPETSSTIAPIETPPASTPAPTPQPTR